jgi:hypothetical protein
LLYFYFSDVMGKYPILQEVQIDENNEQEFGDRQEAK